MPALHAGIVDSVTVPIVRPSTFIPILGETSQQGHITPINVCNKHPSLDNSQNPHILVDVVRAKLLEEASKPNNSLRRLVGHANLLDMLYIELDDTNYESGGCIQDGEVHEEWHESERAPVEDEDNSKSATGDSDDSNDSDSEPDEGRDMSPKSNNYVHCVVSPLASKSKPLTIFYTHSWPDVSIPSRHLTCLDT
ncbi:hypothetical protein J3458_020562 [Metarhizium acridum]|uniref:Uncharacterized protein n=1 Tax=Metarhizium acridum (strain CQMa 102) TaxID=655827 RepID=E9EBP4_METAQ|nr:uncharacterized protein MAC_07292 [Metarhizium acridum CQMa 102]EFY86694.1 hypothetical protein MAC_07292 [Metarhizium acridum CQMa 102]KAG8407068.1 hypothetical protein J3458_020562 [Metarhizium acridum]